MLYVLYMLYIFIYVYLSLYIKFVINNDSISQTLSKLVKIL